MKSENLKVQGLNTQVLKTLDGEFPLVVLVTSY